MIPIDDYSYTFDWYPYNGTQEPYKFIDSPNYQILNKTYYGSGMYFNFTLNSE